MSLGPVVIAPPAVLPIPDDALETLLPGRYDFDVEKLAALESLLARDVQSNILRGNGRLHARFVFVRFGGSRRSARQLIAALLTGVSFSCDGAASELRVSHFGCETRSPERDASVTTAASDFGRMSAPQLNVLLTAAGYRALGADPEVLGDRAFLEGTRAARTIDKLLDPEPVDWEAAYQKPWHALIVVAHDDQAVLSAAERALADCCKRIDAADTRTESLGVGDVASAARIALHVERANMLDRFGRPSADAGENFEIFGFRDGISQPVFLPRDFEHAKIAQYGGREPKQGADPRAPLSLVLVRDPYGCTLCGADRSDVRFGLGSFFVFRKLEQDYHGFDVRKELYKADVRNRRDFLEALYETKVESTPGADRSAHINPYGRDRTDDEEEFVLRSLMGRNRLGVPNHASTLGELSESFNDFDYSADREGAVCPFTAHIRKANPRGATGDLERERRRRIVRRGLPYGTRHGRPKHQLKAEAGLFFLCAQADIAGQFEHIQGVWLNGRLERAGLPHPGIDALIGQLAPKGPNEPHTTAYPSPYGRRPGLTRALCADEQQQRAPRHGWINQTVRMEFDFHDYVELKGAEYLFAPSLSGLACLAALHDTHEPHERMEEATR